MLPKTSLNLYKASLHEGLTIDMVVTIQKCKWLQAALLWGVPWNVCVHLSKSMFLWLLWLLETFIYQVPTPGDLGLWGPKHDISISHGFYSVKKSALVCVCDYFHLNSFPNAIIQANKPQTYSTRYIYLLSILTKQDTTIFNHIKYNAEAK